MGANTKDGSKLTGLILARRRRLTNELLVKNSQNAAAPVVFGDWLFDLGGPTNYQLTAQGGAYTLTGQQAVIERDRNLTASGGSYSLTGQQVTLTKGTPANNYVLTAQGGTYSLAGQSAVIKRDRRLTASGGSYSVTGQQITLLRTKRIVATGGSYVLTGQAASLLRSKRIIASGGAYAVAGQQVNITFAPNATNYTLTAQGGVYSLSGGGADISVGSQAEPNYSAEVQVRPWYIKRGKKIHIFRTAEQADAFLDAERQAQEAIDKAQETSRQARRRAKKRVYEAVEHETVDIDLLGKLAQAFSIKADIPALVEREDWMQLVALSLLAQQMRDEEDIEVLLMA